MVSPKPSSIFQGPSPVSSVREKPIGFGRELHCLRRSLPFRRNCNGDFAETVFSLECVFSNLASVISPSS
ncbi:hypothetical protein LINPERHAP1_LOCUS30081 [Linum perenne]